MCWRALQRRLRRGRGRGLRTLRRCCAAPGSTWRRVTLPTCRTLSRPIAHRCAITRALLACILCPALVAQGMSSLWACLIINVCDQALSGRDVKGKRPSVQASLGGAPTRQSQIQAFLRVREKDAGPLDFDSPGGADTTWHCIYLCLRSGFYKEAVEVLCSLVP